MEDESYNLWEENLGKEGNWYDDPDYGDSDCGDWNIPPFGWQGMTQAAGFRKFMIGFKSLAL